MPLQPPVRWHGGPPPYPLLSAHLPLECQPCTDKGLLTAVAPGPSTVPGTLYAQHSLPVDEELGVGVGRSPFLQLSAGGCASPSAMKPRESAECSGTQPCDTPSSAPSTGLLTALLDVLPTPTPPPVGAGSSPSGTSTPGVTSSLLSQLGMTCSSCVCLGQLPDLSEPGCSP